MPARAQAIRSAGSGAGSPESTTAYEDARHARQYYGDALPSGSLSPEAYKIYERLYGAPLETASQEAELQNTQPAEEAEANKEVLLRENEQGELEEVSVDGQLENFDGLSDEEVQERIDQMSDEEFQQLVDEGVIEEEDEGGEEPPEPTTLHGDSALDPATERLLRDINAPSGDPLEPDAEAEQDDIFRAHPYTVAGRFATSPSTLQLPKETLVQPITDILANLSNKHISEVAHKVLGGRGLPYSPSTPNTALSKGQKPVALEAGQSQMSEMEADVYMAAVLPATYASIMSILIEVRKRLGSDWIGERIQKDGGSHVLDAGAGGAGVLAWRDIVRAEWKRMHEGEDLEQKPAPLGRATVLTGSDTLRHRASMLLENTSFIPRLPDYVKPDHEQSEQPRKQYDVIFAPHTLWTLREEYMRKQHLQNLWSLLNPDGGVLILVEKGLPRGFEVIGGARDTLLEKYIAAPGTSPQVATSLLEENLEFADIVWEGEEANVPRKEPGMIIAPCTNHVRCPMYRTPGVSLGRKDFCHFNQRYIRPPFLQNILGAKDKNHEDVQFSYVAVMRGRDMRQDADPLVQGESATERALEGYEEGAEEMNGNVDVQAQGISPSEEAVRQYKIVGDSAVEQPAVPRHPNPLNTLALPRAIFPPIKRRGHVILDLCTPSGTLERWTVPRSFSRLAFRDARKSKHGDLWALGAKTRVPRTARLGRKDEKGSSVPAFAAKHGKGGRKGAGLGGGLSRREAKGKTAANRNVFDVQVGNDGRVRDVKLLQEGMVKEGKRNRKGKITLPELDLLEEESRRR